MGIEAITVTKDVCRLDNKGSTEVLNWGLEMIIVEDVKLWTDVTGFKVEDEADCRGVNRRMSEMDSKSRAGFPSRQGFATGQFGVEDIAWTSEWVDVIEIGARG